MALQRSGFYILSRKLSTVKCHNVAMILHGCGVYDGTEVHEAVSMLINLSKFRTKVTMFAPNQKQADIINHIDGSKLTGERNVLVESARIARGHIFPLTELKVSNFDALFIPGGFGAAKNLSDFASAYASCSVISNVESVLQQFHSDSKPMGLCCIAPVLAAHCLPGVEVTVGQECEQGGRWPFASVHQFVKQMGAIHIPREVTDIHVDEKTKVVTTPAYMCADASVFEIFNGIGKLVEAVLTI